MNASKQAIKRIGGKLWRNVKRPKHRSVILNYHSIHPTHPFSTKPTDFEMQINFLKTNFKVITLSELYDRLKEKKIEGNNYAVVTFDDGYEDNYTYALPILHKFGIKPTIFVTTGFVEYPELIENFLSYRGLKPLTLAQIKELRSKDVEIGSHTHTHKNLAKLPYEKVLEDLKTSKHILEEQLSSKVRFLAYPFGQMYHFNSETIEAARQAGFGGACTTTWGPVSESDMPFVLPRIRIDPWDTIEDFKCKVMGRWDYIRYFQAGKSHIYRNFRF